MEGDNMRQLTEKQYEQRELMSMYFLQYSNNRFTFESGYFKGAKVIARIDRNDVPEGKVINKTLGWLLSDFELTNCTWV